MTFPRGGEKEKRGEESFESFAAKRWWRIEFRYSFHFRPVFIRGLRALRESWRETRGREREKREEERWKGEESGRGRNELIFIYANGIGGSG